MTTIDLIAAESDLKDAIKKYIRASAEANGTPIFDVIDIEQFVGVATMQKNLNRGVATAYMTFISPDRQHHEVLGLVATLYERAKTKGL
jgi:hypothetical protein